MDVRAVCTLGCFPLEDDYTLSMAIWLDLHAQSAAPHSVRVDICMVAKSTESQTSAETLIDRHWQKHQLQQSDTGRDINS